MTEEKNRHSLTLRQQVDLANFMVKNYAESKLDNARFSEHASKELGYPVTQMQVQRCRSEMGLVPNKFRRLPETIEKGTMMARIDSLEQQVGRLLFALGEKSDVRLR